MCNDPETLTISGAGTGGQLAHRAQIGASSHVKGAGVMHAEPWFDWRDVGCTDDLRYSWSHRSDTEYCETMSRFLPDLDLYLLDVHNRVGLIDELSNIVDSKIWHYYNNAADSSSLHNASNIEGIYGSNGIVDYAAVINSAGAFNEWGVGSDALEYLLGKLGKARQFPDSECPEEHGSRQLWDQQELLSSFSDLRVEDIGLARWGWIYIPDDCLTEICDYHIALHGDIGGQDGPSGLNTDDAFDQDGYYMQYVNYAARNHVVLIEPRAVASGLQ